MIRTIHFLWRPVNYTLAQIPLLLLLHLTTGSCVYHENHCDIEPLPLDVLPCSNAYVDSAFHFP